MAALDNARMRTQEDMDYGGAAATADQSPVQEAVDHAKEQFESLRYETRRRAQGAVPLCVRVPQSQAPVKLSSPM